MLAPPLPPTHACGVDDGPPRFVPSPVLGVGHFSRAPLGHSCQAPKRKHRKQYRASHIMATIPKKRDGRWLLGSFARVVRKGEPTYASRRTIRRGDPLVGSGRQERDRFHRKEEAGGIAREGDESELSVKLSGSFILGVNDYGDRSDLSALLQAHCEGSHQQVFPKSLPSMPCADGEPADEGRGDVWVSREPPGSFRWKALQRYYRAA